MMIHSPGSLFEITNRQEAQTRNPLSTITFDWLYVILSLLLTIGIMMDVWSHTEFGPDQSIFNEYHLLFYGAMGAIMMLLIGLHQSNVRKGYDFSQALPQGYGLALLATILFGISGAVDLTGHALFGFESDVEALTSPTHLLLFINWFLILFGPVRAAKARIRYTGERQNFVQSLPMLIGYGCMICCFSIPLMEYLPMGSEPYMLQWYRPEDMNDGLVMGISGTLLQTIIYIGFVLWLSREFRVPMGGFTVVMLIIGGFFTVITDWLEPYGMFIIFGVLLDLLYLLLKPDATNRSRYVAFGFLAAAAMWTANYGWLVYKFGMNNIYYSGYNLYGSIAQAIVLGGITAWVFSQSTPQAQFDISEVSRA